MLSNPAAHSTNGHCKAPAHHESVAESQVGAQPAAQARSMAEDHDSMLGHQTAAYLDADDSFHVDARSDKKMKMVDGPGLFARSCVRACVRVFTVWVLVRLITFLEAFTR